MDEIDLQMLDQLLTLLRAAGVREFHRGELHIVLAGPEAVPAKPIEAPVEQPRRSVYERALRGRIPSFEQYRDAGLVTE